MPGLNALHRLVVLAAFGRFVKLRITKRHRQRPVPHQLFENFQLNAGVQKLGGESMPQIVRSIMLTDTGFFQVAHHAPVNGSDIERLILDRFTRKQPSFIRIRLSNISSMLKRHPATNKEYGQLVLCCC